MKSVKKRIQRLLDQLLSAYHRISWDRSGPAVKASQILLLMQYRTMIAQGIPLRPAEARMRVYSGTDDDGVLLCIFAALGFRTRVCIDVGSSDGINSNCANFIQNFGFHGLLIDGDRANIERGRAIYRRHPDTLLYQPQFKQSFVTAENINALIKEAGIAGEIDLLSIDIDGNDFWVWKAVNQVQPRVVIIETHVEFGRRNIVVPYDPLYSYPGKHPQYHGASPTAMIELGRQKKYRLVATNGYGFNFIFVKNDEGTDILPEISLDEALSHPRNKQREELFKEIENWKYTSA